jgi:hypothetical protein
LIKKLDSVRYNPNHHMRRVVPVGDRSSIDGGSLTDALEVLRVFLAVSYSDIQLLWAAAIVCMSGSELKALLALQLAAALGTIWSFHKRLHS